MLKRLLSPGLALIVVAGLLGWFLLRNTEQKNAFAARELATRALGRHLTAAHPGARLVIISNPYVQMGRLPGAIAQMEEAGVNGLKEALGSGVACEGVVYPELSDGAKTDPRSVLMDNETTTPLSFLVATNAFDELARQHPDCDLFVSLIGLPENLDELQCWRSPGKPAFALLLPDLRWLGGAEQVKEAMHRGKLVAFVLNKPGAPDSRHAIQGDEPEEFDKRFLLVTKENIESVVQKYPQLF